MDAVKIAEAFTILTTWSPVAIASLFLVYLAQKWMDRRPDIIRGNGESWDRLGVRITQLEDRLGELEAENRQLRIRNVALETIIIAHGMTPPALPTELIDKATIIGNARSEGDA